MNIVFFKRPKPKAFDYKPIYYDPDKEEAEERKKASAPGGSTDPRERMRANMERNWRRREPTHDERYKYIRLAFYVIFIAFAIYFVFFTPYINKLVSFFIR